MGKPPSKPLQEFMAKYEIDAEDVWEVRPGSGNYAIKHKAIERAAAKAGIVFDRPALVESNSAEKIAVVIVFAKMGERTEWSFGEASPANNKNAYCYSMAEKRGKDRCALKLLDAHGYLYSEEELDEPQKRANPHVTRPEDIMPATEYDEHGEVIDNIPHGDETIERMSKAKARPDFAVCQNEIHACKSIETLERWGNANRNRVATFPTDWAEMLRGIYTEHRDTLRAAKIAAE